MCFLILFYHYFSEHGPLPGLLNEVLSLYAVAVALFMTISGFLIFDKLSAVKETKERWKIVKHQVVRIYSIYLIWSIPYLILLFQDGTIILFHGLLSLVMFKDGYLILHFIQSGLCQC